MSNTQNKITGSILIVDDIPENLQVLGNILLAKGMDVGFATNGYQALENIKINPPDLILLDVMMPGMNGFTVCEKIKADAATADIPVIFLTAKAQTEDIVKGFEAGAVDYVTKPFNAGELLARVYTQLELKKSHDIIAEQNLQLQELNSTKDKFFSIIAHDLRGPFSGILGLSDLLAQEHESLTKNEIMEFHGKIHVTLKSQYNLLENLLQWASMQTKRYSMNPVNVLTQQVVKEAFNPLQANADKKNVKLVNTVEDMVTVFADRFMLRSILHNLLSNAIKFTPMGGRITVSFRKDDLGAVISIKDTGMGISEENLSKLFRIDVQHTSLGTEKEKGSGLGLLICKEMMDKHKGTIAVDSILGEGTEFLLYFPNEGTRKDSKANNSL